MKGSSGASERAMRRPSWNGTWRWAVYWRRTRCLRLSDKLMKLPSGVVYGRQAQSEVKYCLHITRSAFWTAELDPLQGHLVCLTKGHAYNDLHDCMNSAHAMYMVSMHCCLQYGLFLVKIKHFKCVHDSLIYPKHFGWRKSSVKTFLGIKGVNSEGAQIIFSTWLSIRSLESQCQTYNSFYGLYM